MCAKKKKSNEENNAYCNEEENVVRVVRVVRNVHDKENNGGQNQEPQHAREFSRKTSTSKKMRLDDLLVSRGYYENKDVALRAIMAGDVHVDDAVAKSAGARVSSSSTLRVKEEHKYVSRGGLKLEGALDTFEQNVEGLRCIDIGSSTGGFSDCLLQRGAKSVACIDVNYGQLAWKLRKDARVKVFERTNIRTVDPALVGAPFDVLVADLSFIGLSSLAPTFASYCEDGSVLIALVKPQFESQQGETENGYVSSEEVRQRCVQEVRDALESAGFHVTHTTTSSIKGKKRGNVEYLVRAVFVGEALIFN